MKKYIITVVLCLVLVATSFVVAGCDNDVLPGSGNGSGIIWSQQDTGIWVSGTGTVTVVPDVAILSLRVEVQAPTVAMAMAQAAVDMDRVINSLKANGVLEEDIKTQAYNIYPVRRWIDDREVLIGYRATNTVTVKIRDIAETGVIIDEAVKAAGDSIRINSIGFTVDDPETYYDEARQKAMEDAKDKAVQLANLGDVTLGKPTYIGEGSFYIPVRYDNGLKEAADAGTIPMTPISPGEMEISLTVKVVYAIK